MTEMQKTGPQNPPSQNETTQDNVIARAMAQSAATFLLADAQGRITYANDRLVAMLGLEISQLLGAPLTALWDQPSEQTQRIMAQLQAHGAWQGEIRHKCRDGRLFWELVTITAVKDPDGEIAQLIKLGQDISDKKAVDDLPLHTQKDNREILESINEGYIETDLSGNITFLNKGAARIYKRPAHELLDLNYKNYMSPEQAQAIYEDFNDVYLTGIHNKIIGYEVIGGDGSTVACETVITLVCDESGEPIGFRGIVRDVTEKRKIEAVLKKSEEKYRHVLEHMEEGYYEVDLEGNFTMVNEATCQNLGRTQAEVMGLSYQACMPPADAQRALENFVEVYKSGLAVKIFKCTLIKKDGTFKYHEMSVSLLKNEAGEPVGFYGLSRDRTEQIGLERALRESEESYRRVMELAPDAITISRLSDGTYFEVNDAFCDQTGYTRDYVIGRSVIELNIYADPADRDQMVNALQLHGQVEGMALTFRHKDGSILHDLVSARIIQFKGEECVLVVATVINSLVEAQQALQEREVLYRNILEAAPDAICLTRLADGQYIEANNTFYERTGFTPAETIGHTTSDINIYQDPSDRHRLLETLNREGRVDGMEVPFRYKNGQVSINLVGVRAIQHNGEPCLLVISKEIDELKAYQQALEKSEKFYRTILNTAPYSVTIIRLSDSRYLQVNQGFCDRTGYRPEEVIGRTPLDINIYSSSEEHKRLSEAFRKNGHVDHMEINFQGKDGRVLESIVSARAIKFNGDDCRLVISLDIAPLKAAQRAIEEREESALTILKTVPNSITISRLSDGTYLQVNDAFCDHTGYTREEVLGRTAGDLRIYDDIAERDRFMEKFRSDGGVDGMEIRFRSKDGSLLESMASARPITFQGQRCALVVTSNIGPLKEAQAALAESEAGYRAILKTAPYTIAISNWKTGRYVEVNDAYCENTGYTRKEVIGRSDEELSLFADPETRARFVAEFKTRGQVDGMLGRFRRKDGSLTESLVSARIITYKGQRNVLTITSNIDDLVAAQKALAENEASYHTILNTAPYSIGVVDSEDGRYLLINKAYCTNTGYAPGEVIGKTAMELNVYENANDRDRFLAVYREQGSVDGMEMRYRRKDGSITTSLASAQPMRFKGKRCMLVVTTNIDTLIKAQRALQEREESYRTILDTAPYTIVITRLSDSCYVEANPAFTRRTGYSREETIGRTPQEIGVYVNPAQREEVLQKLQQEGQVQTMEVQFRARDGHILDSLISASPIRYQGHDCMLTMTVDISELKQTQRALQASEESYRKVIESAPNSMSIVRRSDSTYIDVNTAFTRQFGYRREEVVGNTPLGLTLYVDPSVRTQYLKKLKEEGQVFGMEIRFRAQNGREIDGLSSIIPFQYKGEACYLSSTVDITAMKNAQKELEHHRRHLEEMVTERTQALKAAQSELIKREKLSVLGQLTATVSHELRNPLGVIRSSNFYLQRKVKETDQKVDKHFRRIEEQVSVCDAIVGDLLEYTRGRSVSMINEDLTPWLMAVIEQLQDSEGIRISWDLSAKLPAVPHDPEKMRRVVINGLDNAIQAVKAKEAAHQKGDTDYVPQIVVKTDHQADAIMISISDNGPGMDKQTLRHAFEPLFTTRARGTGIGLANVQKIVAEHGGDVTLQSRPGQGTRLTITLPHQTQAAADKTVQQQ